MDLDKDLEQAEIFKFVVITKKGHTLGDMCYKNAECLNSFVLKVFSLKFEEKPDYDDLYRELVDAISVSIQVESKEIEEEKQ
jgi:hypothetical protein